MLVGVSVALHGGWCAFFLCYAVCIIFNLYVCMSVKIRLARAGAKKRPFYRIVVADVRAPRDGSFIERLGAYNPLVVDSSKERVVCDTERVRYWLGVGAQMTKVVERILKMKPVAQ